MAASAAGRLLVASLLALSSVPESLARCMTYKQKQTCGFVGSSVEFPCSYTYPDDSNVTDAFWYKRRPNGEDLRLAPEASGRVQLPGGKNDCTMRLADLKGSDSSVYYFKYSFGGLNSTVARSCGGNAGVRLHVPVSAASVLVKEIVKDQEVTLTEPTLTEGQRIILTCRPTCAERLNSDPAYVWYKNRQQLNSSRANTSFLPLDPISSEDTGTYSCAPIGHEDPWSPAVNLSVRYGPRNTTVSVQISGSGRNKRDVVTLTCSSDANPPVHEYTWYKRGRAGDEALQTGTERDIAVASFKEDDVYLCEAVSDISTQNSTDVSLKKYLKPRDTALLFKILISLISAGLVVTIVIPGAFLVPRIIKRCKSSVPPPPDPDADPYAALDIRQLSAEYDTLDNVKGCPIYENLQVYNTNTEEEQYDKQGSHGP